VTTSACPLPPCQVPTHKRQIEVLHPPMCSVLRATLLLNWRVQPKQLCFQPRSNLHQIDITIYSFINSTFAHSLPTWRSQWRLLSPMVRANTDLEVLWLNRVIQVRNFAPVLALWQVARSVLSQFDSAEQRSPDFCSTFISHYFRANFLSWREAMQMIGGLLQWRYVLDECTWSIPWSTLGRLFFLKRIA